MKVRAKPVVELRTCKLAKGLYALSEVKIIAFTNKILIVYSLEAFDL